MELNISKKSQNSSIKASQSTFYTQSSDSLFIILDSNTYTAGDKVTGEILLSLHEAFNDSELVFSASGTEEVTVFDPVDQSRLLVEEKSEVFYISNPIYKWQYLNAGQYIFPFSLKIPAHCPSSFYFSSVDERKHYIKASISYEITVNLLTATSKFSQSALFFVKNKLALTRSQIKINTIEEIRGCCSLQGTTKFVLSTLNNEHCEVGGQLLFRLEPDNKNCKAPINRVISKVLVEVTFSTSRGEYKLIKELASIDRAAWVSGQSSLTFIKDFEYCCGLEVHEMNLSSNLTPVIKCEYFLKIFVFYDTFGKERPVELVINFHVNPKLQGHKEIPVLPENWNPEEFGITAFVWGGSAGYEIKNMTGWVDV